MKEISLSRKERKALIRISLALAAFLIIFLTDKILGLADIIGGKFGFLLPFSLYLTVYLLIGYDVLWRAIRNILNGRFLDENFLMCLATIGAFSLAIIRGATGKEADGFDEACAVLLFYQIGEFFQSYAVGKSRKSISALMDIRPDYANLKRNDAVITVAPDDAEVGDIIVVYPGEKIPLDGVVAKGASSIDAKALTGESLPRDVTTSDEVHSGSINLTSVIEVKVTKKFHDGTVSKILELVENASEQKSRAENFIAKFARYYTPAVVVVALLLAVIPGAISGEWSTWIYRALSFLVVSCPCALVISIPLTFFAGIGAASRYGILIKGSDYLEKFNKASAFVFDKTGTLTKGNFVVTKVFPEEKREEILGLAAIAERGSSHPIAGSILAAYGKEEPSPYTLTNIVGAGISATDGETEILCGNANLMRSHAIDFREAVAAGTVVYVARNGAFEGYVVIEDEVKEEAAAVIRELNAMNAKTIMLTGDNDAIAASVAEKLGLTGYKAELFPQNKVDEVEKLMSEKEVLCFVGDGINDAPVLMRSDIGIAMGGVGSDAAIEASDIVLMRDDLRGISVAKRIARKTMAIVNENIVFSIAVKVAILLLSALGITNMWVAVFGDVGVAIIAILNAIRVNSRYD